MSMRSIILLLLGVCCLAPMQGTAKEEKGKIILIPKEQRGSEVPVKMPLFFYKNIPQGMIMYRVKVQQSKEYVVVSPEAAKSSGERYYRRSDGKYEIYTTVKKVVKDTEKKVFIVGYKGNPLATGEMLNAVIKRIGVYEHPGEGTLPAYKFETK